MVGSPQEQTPAPTSAQPLIDAATADSPDVLESLLAAGADGQGRSADELLAAHGQGRHTLADARRLLNGEGVAP